MHEVKLCRNSSIEVLRIISMLLIVIFHYLNREYGLYVVSNDLLQQANIQSKLIISSLGWLGVPIFVFISGFYGIRFRKDRIADLILQGIFYMAVSCVGLYCIDNVLYWKEMYNFLNEWWFLNAYIIIYVLSPGIEWMFKNLSYKRMFGIIVLIYFMAYSSSFPGNSGGGGLLNFLSMYLLSRFLSLYLKNYLRNMAIWWSLGLLFFRIALIILLIHTRHLGLVALINVYSNPLNILIAAGIFFSVYRKHFTSKIINWLSASTLSVYLFSESDFGKVFFIPLFGVENYSVVHFIVASVIVYMTIALIDKIRIPITGLLTRKFTQ